MAIFSNQATLTYNGNTTNSNIAYGEILDVLVATKTSVEGDYTPGDLVTYVVTLRNTGTSALSGLTVQDDLGGYPFGATTVYPLTYEAGSAAQFTNGAPQPAPAVDAGPPLVISDISVPAGGDVVIVYQARVNAYADPAAENFNDAAYQWQSQTVARCFSRGILLIEFIKYFLQVLLAYTDTIIFY